MGNERAEMDEVEVSLNIYSLSLYLGIQGVVGDLCPHNTRGLISGGVVTFWPEPFTQKAQRRRKGNLKSFASSLRLCVKYYLVPIAVLMAAIMASVTLRLK